jgi:DNA (cytosine-5)-methyltransferase 1
MEVVWQCEIDPYAQRVLAKHWPSVRRWEDVRTFPPAGDWSCDLVCGGFPCQDISNAGRRAGIDGERSGLWGEFARVLRVVRPRYALVENSAALLNRGMGRVLSDLAECGYDAEWDCLPAAAFGALHIRNRVFLLAYPNGQRLFEWRYRTVGREQCSEGAEEAARLAAWRGDPDGCELTPDVYNAMRRRYGSPEEAVFAGRGSIELSDWWSCEPAVGRVAYGVPSRVDRVRCLGNAVVPQVVEWIGRRILAVHNGRP